MGLWQPKSKSSAACFLSTKWGKTHSSMALDSNGDLLQIPEIYSARYGEVALPATFRLLNWFQEAVPVHRPLLFCM